MALEQDLKTEVAKIFRDQWMTRTGYVVPEPATLGLANDGVEIDAAILYADMAESTALVDSYKASFAAEVYKAYLACCARIIKNNGGQIRSYDGDRVMGIFIGDKKETAAARTALQINYAVKNIVNPAIATQYPTSPYKVGHAVGIDASKIFAARIGVRNANEIVWVGRAANYAAKLCTFRDGYTSWITGSAYNALDLTMRMYNGNAIWEPRLWTARGNMSIYRSNWTWTI